MQLAVLIPVKSFDQAKSRLSPHLSVDEREALAKENLLHVLNVLQTIDDIAETFLLSPSLEVKKIAEEHQMQWLEEPMILGQLGAIIDYGLLHINTYEATHALVLMSDLPKLTSENIRSMIETGQEVDVALAPDEARMGTNALMLNLDKVPKPVQTHFGHADSAKRHTRHAYDNKLSFAMVQQEGLSFDIDHIDDLLATGER